MPHHGHGLAERPSNPEEATRTCPKCGAINNARYKYCFRCGTRLSPLPQKGLPLGVTVTAIFGILYYGFSLFRSFTELASSTHWLNIDLLNFLVIILAIFGLLAHLSLLKGKTLGWASAMVIDTTYCFLLIVHGTGDVFWWLQLFGSLVVSYLSVSDDVAAYFKGKPASIGVRFPEEKTTGVQSIQLPTSAPSIRIEKRKAAGVQSTKTCPKCGAINDASFKFCFRCGTRLPSLPPTREIEMEIKKYKEYLDKLEALRRERKVSEKVYEKLKEKYGGKLKELVEKLKK
jgi:uncharacterized paraquat-inducible protein A